MWCPRAIGRKAAVFSIGEFSKVTGLTVKTLRFYHEQGILIPSHVDEQTGYRYYNESKIETARVISSLRTLEFTVSDISEILSASDDEADLLTFLERQRASIREKLKHYRQIDASLDQIIFHEREVQNIMNNATFEIEEKNGRSDADRRNSDEREVQRLRPGIWPAW